MADVASFSVSHDKRTMPVESQSPKTYIYQVSKEFWKKKNYVEFFCRQVVAILIIGGKLKI